MRKIILSVFLIILISPVFAQRQPWWFSLEQGKIMFRGSDYGSALLLFEDARRDRRAMYEQMERDFINLLSIVEVRRIGDSLDLVERYSYDRHYTAASKALEELYYRIPKTNFHNSAASALQAFDKLKNYPEAEYWIGEIYRVEGELSLALAQYRRAYEMRDVLENADFNIDLQYKIAGILKTRQEYNEMERMYLSIINDLDTLWTNARRAESTRNENVSNGRNNTPVPYAQASSSFASQSMTRTLENEGIRRFLEMYRYNNSIVENAHRQLGFYYAATGRPTAQNHLMFAFLIQNTIIINEITKHQFDFSFSDLSELTAAINKNPLLLSYIDTVEYYKTAYYLSASLYRNGKTTVARNFWEFLADTPQAGEWYNRAVLQLRSPRQEPLVEMP
jgi:tetratricopeptide (TPR) repeat protein